MAEKDMMIKSIGDGWLLVRLDEGAIVSVPEYCHVKFRESANGRDAITIQEGPYVGKAASVKSGFLTERKHDLMADLQFYLRSNALTWPGGPAVKPKSGGGVSGGLASFTDPSNPVPSGRWDVDMPDFPHDLGSGYVGFAAHAKTWFRIAAPDSNDRYIHPGTVSLGCTTVGIKSDKATTTGQTALSHYEDVYAYLIARRKTAGVVGQIQVFDY